MKKTLIWLMCFLGTLAYGAVIHHAGGTMAANETWTAEDEHVLDAALVIPDGVTLTIVDGAAVSFAPGAKFVFEDTGRIVQAAASCRTDVRKALVAAGTERVSPVAAEANDNPKFLVDYVEAAGWTKAAPQWDSAGVADGERVMTLEGEDVSRVIEVLNGDDVAVHGGVMEANETWTADKTHVIRHAVRVPAGRTLTIADNTTLRFCEDTEILGEGDVVYEGSIHVIVEGDITRPTFMNNTAIVSLKMDDSVTEICASAFEGCVNLEEVILSRNLTRMGAQAFMSCAKLTTVHFPYDIMHFPLDSYCFEGCTNLTWLIFSGQQPMGKTPWVPAPNAHSIAYRTPSQYGIFEFTQWLNLDGQQCGGTTVQLEDVPVSSDGKFVCQVDCKGYVWLLKYLGNVIDNGGGDEANAVQYDEGDEVVVVPASMSVFGGLPVWRLCKNAFLLKSNIRKLVLPDTLECMDSWCVKQCPNIAHVIFEGNKPPAFNRIASIQNNTALFNDIDPHLLAPETPLWRNAISADWKFHEEDISFHVGGLGYHVEADGSATLTTYAGDDPDLVIPSVLNGHPVTSIAEGAFQNNTFIQSVTIPDGLEVADDAFEGCTSLDPDKVKKSSSFTYNLPRGWNIIAPTLELTEASKQALLDKRLATYAANGSVIFLSTQAELIVPGAPLVLFCEAPTSITVDGMQPEAWALNVASGWHMVGIVQDVPRAEWPANLKAVWRWSNEGKWPKYETYDGDLEAGQAYWLQGE